MRGPTVDSRTLQLVFLHIAIISSTARMLNRAYVALPIKDA